MAKNKEKKAGKRMKKKELISALMDFSIRNLMRYCP